MLHIIFIPIIEGLIVIITVLITVAYTTVAERKTMASMQRRLGPNIVGHYGILQAFADALKLILKEYISPTQSNLTIFFLGPVITLIFSLLGYAVIPYGPGLAITDFNLGILYMLALSSLSTYGILLAGWSANSKYAFLGSLRSTAQLISYELILSSAILLVVLFAGSLSLTVNVEAQRAIWFVIPLLPIFVIFFIGSVAETNRAPFDLAEAESELVSGFMTEHAAVIFVFFFLGEYASIVLICVLITILFLGGYLLDLPYIIYTLMLLYDVFEGILYYILECLDFYFDYILSVYFIHLYPDITNLNPLTFPFIIPFYFNNEVFVFNSFLEGMFNGLALGLKSCIMIFIFIWVRASYPRIRFDQLMSFCWTILLPIVIAFIILMPCFVYGHEMITCNVSLL